MKAKAAVVVVAVGIAVAATMALFRSRHQPIPTADPQALEAAPSSDTAVQPDRPPAREIVAHPDHRAATPDRLPLPSRLELPSTLTNKLERLALIRESFHSLAAGDRATAMRA